MDLFLKYWDQMAVFAGQILFYLTILATFLSRLLPKVVNFSQNASEFLDMLVRWMPTFGTNPSTKKLIKQIDELKSAADANKNP